MHNFIHILCTGGSWLIGDIRLTRIQGQGSLNEMVISLNLIGSTECALSQQTASVIKMTSGFI